MYVGSSIRTASLIPRSLQQQLLEPTLPPLTSCIFLSHVHPFPSPSSSQIISQTAKFVRANGIQVEVKLRVQQAGNPKFDFLNTQDRLFPYYRYGTASGVCVQGRLTSAAFLQVLWALYF